MFCFLKRLVYLFIGAVIFTLAACAPTKEEAPITDSDQTSEPESSLINTNWQLVSFGEPGFESPVIEGTELTLQFDENSQAGGSGGCNSFGAQYETVGEDKLSITEIVSTLMACTDEGVMEQEGRYLEALQSASSYELTGDRLIIWYENEESALNFSRILNGTN